MIISVVIIAKNEEKNIYHAIQKIYNQNYPKKDIEIIVVSDGSKDNTVKKAIRNSDKVIALNESYGISVVRNIGVLESRGDVILFIDAHIFINKNALDTINKIFLTNPDIYGVCGKYYTPFDGLDSIRNIRYEALSGKNRYSRPINLNRFTTFSGGIGVFRRDVFDKILFREDFRGFAGEDIFFELEVLNNNMSLYFEPGIKGRHYEKTNNLKSFYKRIIKDVRGFSKVIIKSADSELAMPKIDNYYLHFPLFLSISLLLSTISLYFFICLALAVVIELLFIKNIWRLNNYNFIEKMLASFYSLIISFLKIFFVPVFVFYPNSFSFSKNISALVVNKEGRARNKHYSFKNKLTEKSYALIVIERIRYVLKLFFIWEIMKIKAIIINKLKLT